MEMVSNMTGNSFSEVLVLSLIFCCAQYGLSYFTESERVVTDGNYATYTFQRAYPSPPVVIATPYGDNRYSTRVSDVSCTGFKVRLDAFDGSVVPTNIVNFIAFPSSDIIGDETLMSRFRLQTYRYIGLDKVVSLRSTLAEGIVIAGVQTSNNNGIKSLYARGNHGYTGSRSPKSYATVDTFVTIEGGGSVAPALNETIGIVVMDKYSDGLMLASATLHSNFPIEICRTKESINHVWTTISFSSTFSTPPIVVAYLLTENGLDPSQAHVTNITTTSFLLSVQEMLGYDRVHTSEQVHYMVIPSGVAFFNAPTSQPSSQPSNQPTQQPTLQLSTQPSSKPSSQPSRQSSTGPISQPSVKPSGQPSQQPTSQPSGEPSRQPSWQPWGVPSSQPSLQPSGQPSRQPTSQPSVKPSGQPTQQPTVRPFAQPSTQPTVQPSNQPSVQPSGQPTKQPSGIPSWQPSGQPSSIPTCQPTMLPTSQPSNPPSTLPTSFPTMFPSGQPTLTPTTVPSLFPSSMPFAQPTLHPTSRPTCQPFLMPTTQPSASPSMFPSSQPTSQPSCSPTSQPSMQPTSTPTVFPSSVPSSIPTNQPSSQPSGFPLRAPSNLPTTSPTRVPRAQPFTQRTFQPTKY